MGDTYVFLLEIISVVLIRIPDENEPSSLAKLGGGPLYCLITESIQEVRCSIEC